MNENYIVINGKRAELTKEQMEQLGIEVEKDKRWRAKANKVYWHVTSYNHAEPSWAVNSNHDDFRYYSHNYFRTEEEAKTYARVLETEMLLKRYADEHNEKFGDYKCCIIWLLKDNKYQIEFVSSYVHRPRIVFFSSKEITQNAIKEIGEDRIIKYLTYEW